MSYRGTVNKHINKKITSAKQRDALVPTQNNIIQCQFRKHIGIESNKPRTFETKSGTVFCCYTFTMWLSQQSMFNHKILMAFAFLKWLTFTRQPLWPFWPLSVMKMLSNLDQVIVIWMFLCISWVLANENCTDEFLGLQNECECRFSGTGKNLDLWLLHYFTSK